MLRVGRANEASAERRRGEARIADALDSIREGFALYDAEDRLVLCNARYRQMYEASADLMVAGATFADIIRGGAARGQYVLGGDSIDEWVAHRLTQRRKLGEPFEQRLATGEWYLGEDRRTSDGGIISIRIDITELKQREASFRLLFDNNPLPMWVYEFKTLRFLEVNNAAIRHYGFSREQFLAMTIEQLRSPEDVETLRRARGGGGDALRQLGVSRHVKADGAVILVEVTVHQLVFRGCNAALVVAIDVTESKRAENALRASEARLRQSEQHLALAQRVSETGSIMQDVAGGTGEWSEGLYRILGIEAGSRPPTFKTFLEFVHPDDRQAVLEGRDLAAQSKRLEAIEYRIVRPDGAVRTLHRVAAPLVDESGAVVRRLMTFRDVTDLRAAEAKQRELEHQLLHSQKLEALGTLAGGIAHDLNNTLVPVLGLGKLTLSRLAEGSRERANVATIVKAGERARDLVRQILTFSRKDTPTREVVDLAALARDSLAMLAASLPATTRIEERIADVPLMVGDAAQLHQVIINLVINADHAIGDAMGTVAVEIASAPAGALDGADLAKPAIRLSVEDNGCGMDEATMRRIFDPFFTTKPVGVGTGLGLSVVHGIVTEHGGRIEVASRPGKGTRFDVLFPALSKEDEEGRLELAKVAI